LDGNHKPQILVDVTVANIPPPAPDKPAEASEEASASPSDKRKQSLYFPESMLEEINAEATRLERSLSWVVQRAWKVARPEIREMPGSPSADETSG
jgi:uncharacterized small protein (TIGR04563 family)